jgi:hypothetical protein
MCVVVRLPYMTQQRHARWGLPLFQPSSSPSKHTHSIMVVGQGTVTSAANLLATTAVQPSLPGGSLRA